MAHGLETVFERDLELAARCRRKEEAAWQELVARFRGILIGMARHQLQRAGLGRSSEWALDLASDFFEQLLANDCHKLESYLGLGSIEGFLAVSAARFIRKRIPSLRRRELTVSLDDAIHDSRPGVPDLEEVDYAAKLIAKLSTEERLLYALHWVEGAPAGACARALGITVETFYARKSRMLKRLRGLCDLDGKTLPARGLLPDEPRPPMRALP